MSKVIAVNELASKAKEVEEEFIRDELPALVKEEIETFNKDVVILLRNNHQIESIRLPIINNKLVREAFYKELRNNGWFVYSVKVDDGTFTYHEFRACTSEQPDRKHNKDKNRQEWYTNACI